MALPARGDRAPEAAFDGDRRAHGVHGAGALRAERDRPAGLAAQVDPRRAAGPKHARGRAVAVQRQSHPIPDEVRVLPEVADHHDLVLVLGAHQADLRRAQQPRDLDDHGVEELRGGGGFGHEGRDPPQGGLLVGQALHLCPSLGIGDRGRDQLGELLEPQRGICRQLLVVEAGRDHGAPKPPGDHDRTADRGPCAKPVGVLGDRPSGRAVVVDPSRRARCGRSAS